MTTSAHLRTATPDELAKVVAAARAGSHWRDQTMLGLWLAGLTNLEQLRAQTIDLQPGGRHMLVRSRPPARRMVPLCGLTVELLQAAPADQLELSPLLRERRAGEPRAWTGWHIKLRGLELPKAGAPDLNVTALRRTGAVLCAREGHPVDLVASCYKVQNLRQLLAAAHPDLGAVHHG